MVTSKISNSKISRSDIKVVRSWHSFESIGSNLFNYWYEAWRNKLEVLIVTTTHKGPYLICQSNRFDRKWYLGTVRQETFSSSPSLEKLHGQKQFTLSSILLLLLPLFRQKENLWEFCVWKPVCAIGNALKFNVLQHCAVVSGLS